MSNTKLKIKNIVVILFAALCSAVSLELFLIPSDVVIGGASGISSILDILFTNNMDSSLWYLSAGVWVFAINIPVIIYCFVSLRKGFALRTLLYVAFMSAMLIVLRITNVSHLVDSVINSNNAGDKVVALYSLRSYVVPYVHHGSFPPVLSSYYISCAASNQYYNDNLPRF